MPMIGAAGTHDAHLRGTKPCLRPRILGRRREFCNLAHLQKVGAVIQGSGPEIIVLDVDSVQGHATEGLPLPIDYGLTSSIILGNAGL